MELEIAQTKLNVNRQTKLQKINLTNGNNKLLNARLQVREFAQVIMQVVKQIIEEDTTIRPIKNNARTKDAYRYSEGQALSVFKRFISDKNFRDWGIS